ncbi:uncharacterized protein LOC104861235 [Fukomys damarensis]|uniref:uncharacterized protein LOC104861235 n=1 Tax=Fukomys damarensis TaxID=885580 RepID=UPI00054031F3|nr:uncharacterized protein LOC104861235 [Fukomys damarensis]
MRASRKTTTDTDRLLSSSFKVHIQEKTGPSFTGKRVEVTEGPQRRRATPTPQSRLTDSSEYREGDNQLAQEQWGGPGTTARTEPALQLLSCCDQREAAQGFSLLRWREKGIKSENIKVASKDKLCQLSHPPGSSFSPVSDQLEQGPLPQASCLRKLGPEHLPFLLQASAPLPIVQTYLHPQGGDSGTLRLEEKLLAADQSQFSNLEVMDHWLLLAPLWL